MPKYRARVEFVDDRGQEHAETVEFEAESDRVEDVARAAQEAFGGLQQSGEERLPHNIEWERLG